MSASVQLRRLGAELRRLRENAGRTQEEVGLAIDRRHTTLVNWERGKTKPSKSDLTCLLAELRAPDDVRLALEQLRQEANHGAGHWIVYGLPSSIQPLPSFEEDATKITVFEPTLIPGLLQTEAYAREIHVAGPYLAPPEYVDRWVAARLRRQQRLVGKKPVKFHAVIAEAALRLEVGGPERFAAQLKQLLVLAERKNIAIQVLPFATGAHPALSGNFAVLHFAEPELYLPVGYYDYVLAGHMVDDEGQVLDMIHMFDDLWRMALDERASIAMIETILKEVEQKGS